MADVLTTLTGKSMLWIMPGTSRRMTEGRIIGILDLDSGVLNTELGTVTMSESQGILRVLGLDVTGERNGARGNIPDVKIMDINNTRDGTKLGHDLVPIDLYKKKLEKIKRVSR